MIRTILRGYLLLKRIALFKFLLVSAPLAVGIGIGGVFLLVGELTGALIAFFVSIFITSLIIAGAGVYVLWRTVKRYHNEMTGGVIGRRHQ